MSADEGFFSRWSRRKAQVRAGLATAPMAPTDGGSAPNRPGVPTSSPAPADRPDPAARSAAPGGDASLAAGPTAPPSEPPLPTLEDVQGLTPRSDFRPFVRPQVAPEVRNAALRKLFADPHFNVMDGLDVYIDDYSRPDPLPADIARRLVAAHAMRVLGGPAPTPAPVPTPDPARLVDGDDAGQVPPAVTDESAHVAPPVAPPPAATPPDAPSASDPVS